MQPWRRRSATRLRGRTCSSCTRASLRPNRCCVTCVAPSMTRSRVDPLALLLLFAACASSRQLTIAEAKQFGERRYEAASDEIYDAAWLALEARGASVIDGDRLAG